MSRARSESDPKPAFAELVRTAPSLPKVVPRTRLAGWLYQSPEEGNFILHANDGTKYELKSESISQFNILHQSESAVSVEIELSLDEAINGSILATGYKGRLDPSFGTVDANAHDSQFVTTSLDGIFKHDTGSPIDPYALALRHDAVASSLNSRSHEFPIDSFEKELPGQIHRQPFKKR